MAADKKAEDVPDQRRMSFFEHLEELRKRFKIVFVVLLVLFVFFAGFDIVSVTLGSTQIPVPVPSLPPDNDPIASKVFRALVAYLKPPWVNLTAKQPWDGVVVQLEVALFLAVVFSSPLSAYEFAKFVGPALKPSEKRLVLRVAAPILILFFSGVLLALVVVLPFTFGLLYSIQRTLGVTVFLLFVDDFVSFVLLFLIAFGLAFELPVLMYGLSAVGMVSADFWKRHWRFAVIAIFFFGAAITPDGSGITMMIVALPMFGLYVVGYVAILNRERRLRGAKSS